MKAPDRVAPSQPDGADQLSRRDFIRVSSLAGGGFLLSLALPGEAGAQPAQALDDSTRAFTPSPFIKITPQGIITILAKNPETGQGVKTSLPMIVAEELDADFSTVVIEQAGLRGDVGAQFAGGSRSTPDNYLRLRRAGATARVMLIEAAAQTWKVPAATLITAHGQVINPATGDRLTYGQLASKAATLPLPDENSVKLKSEDEFKLIGSRVGGVDNPRIVTGQPLFGIDQKLPGLVYAAYEKCPVFGGKVISANLDRIKGLPGVLDAFALEGTSNISGLVPGVAIVARSTWAAFAAKRQLQVVWDESAGDGQATESYAAEAAELARAGGATVRHDGDVDAAFAAAAKVVEGAYSYPFLNHATLEPQGCTAWAKDGGIEFWTTSQTPGSGQDLVSRTLNIPKEKLKLNLVRAGGGFGRRLANDYMVEAAAIALRTNGAPVKLTWTREDDMHHDCYSRPGGFHFLKGAVDAQGRLSAWHNHFVTFGYKSNEKVASSADLSPDEFPARFLANYRLDQSIIPTIVPTGPMRAPRSNALAFVMQSFIDELAHAGGRDPVEFRLELLGEDRVVPPGGPQSGPAYDATRMKNVVRLAAEKSGWGRKLPQGEGMGVAFHFSHSGYIAMVAEVAVAPDGTLKVRRFTAAVDVGPIINLSGAENQVQGSIIDGISTAWLQELTFERGRAVQGNFDTYPLLRSTETPAMAVHFLQSRNPPTGLGEPAYPVVPPALCNAIFAATGKRIRQLPITRNDLRWA
ncbi:MAG TPA: molybdopterin cofactor-binding domain-containing protein [Lacunisphaera sp.]|jgi:isoquinoline 1-oxidoreductase beta subunit|nr:molybdopterin cofactor-binding domain-containing protein [Lacunisphaera sp.]